MTRRYTTGQPYTGEALITVVCACGQQGNTALFVNDRGLDYEHDDLADWDVEIHPPGVYGVAASVRCPDCKAAAR